MLSNPDTTLVAVYHDRDAFYSRPITAIGETDLCYVTDEYGDLIPADEWGDLAFIETAAIINGKDAA